MSSFLNKVKISEKNKIKNIIKENNYSISLSENSISNLKKGIIKDHSFVQKSTEKYNENILSKNKENENLYKKLDDIEKGVLDEEFTKEIKNTTIEDNKNTKKVDETKKIQNDDKKKISEDTKNKISRERYKERSIEKQMNYDLRYYYKTCDNLPQHYIDRIKTTPKNKGFIYRNITFYGTAPIINDQDRDNLVVFEKNIKTNTLYIYVQTPREHITYEKKGNDRKKIISIKPFKKILLLPNVIN
jgi:hypothetical protein